MRYFVNQIWLNEENAIYYRILHIHPQLEVLSWIKVSDESEDLPESISLDDFDDLVKQKKLTFIPHEICKLPSPESLQATAKKKWERNWTIIKEYTTEIALLYNNKLLTTLINKDLTKSTGLSRLTVRRIFLRYWQRGMTKIALIPDYPNSGGKGKIKKSSQLKRGRPSIYSKNELNINDKLRKLLVAGYKEFYLDRKDAGLQDAYEAFIALKFSKKKSKTNSNNIPTYAQFRYWGEKTFSNEEKIRRKVGDIIFKKDYKILTDSSRKDVIGPGSIFQIDSTPSDLELVSEVNGNILTGSPTLYLVTDVFSGMIVGFHSTYENPSYWVAMIALANAIEDKQEFCARYGRHIEKEDWPSCYLPASIVADRGELLGNQAENLVAEFGIGIANTSAYRPDMKGLVERHFQTVHKNLRTLHNNIGLKGQRNGERGVRNARLDACLTLKEYIQVIILEIIKYNSTNFLDGYPLDHDMVMDNLKPVPNLLWSWGIRNRSGALRALTNEKFLLRLLPKKKVSLTKRGVKFLNNFYNLSEGPTEALSAIKNLQINGQNTRTEIEVAYHPWNVSHLYLQYSNQVVIFSVSESRNPIGIDATVWEMEQYNAALKKQKSQHDEDTLNTRIGIIQDINEIASRAKKEPKSKRSPSNIKKIRENKNSEKILNRVKNTLPKAPPSLVDKITNEAGNNSSIQKPNSSQDYKFPSFIDDLENLIND